MMFSAPLYSFCLHIYLEVELIGYRICISSILLESDEHCTIGDRLIIVTPAA